jgi:23S rRNA (cytosine1962-C5)-methyltransferase
MQLHLLTTAPSADYELLDSGEGEKLERFGPWTLRRPDPQALYPKRLSRDAWDAAHAAFETHGARGKWRVTRAAGATGEAMPDTWPVAFGTLTFSATLGSFKHVGVFPEQEPNWQWLKEQVSRRAAAGGKVSVLNLFAYTGGATLACLAAGTEVVHVDASKGIVDVARKNAELSGVADKPVRWIVDDVKKFVAREIRRGSRYHGIIMDPPAFGHGPKKEVWDIEIDLLPLIEEAKSLLADDASFFLLNGYASGFSPVAYAHNLGSLLKKGGTIEAGELSLEEKGSQRPLPAGIFARWRSA